MAVLPAGTGNLLAGNVGLPADPEQAVRLAVDGGRRAVDVGVVDGQVFAVMAGMGFDAAMTGDTSDRLTATIGPVAYVLSAVNHLRDRPMRLVVQVDDHEPLRCAARSVLVGSVGRLQGGVRLMPDAEPDDGLMELAILRPAEPAAVQGSALDTPVLPRGLGSGYFLGFFGGLPFDVGLPGGDLLAVALVEAVGVVPGDGDEAETGAGGAVVARDVLGANVAGAAPTVGTVVGVVNGTGAAGALTGTW